PYTPRLPDTLPIYIAPNLDGGPALCLGRVGSLAGGSAAARGEPGGRRGGCRGDESPALHDGSPRHRGTAGCPGVGRARPRRSGPGPACRVPSSSKERCVIGSITASRPSSDHMLVIDCTPS